MFHDQEIRNATCICIFSNFCILQSEYTPLHIAAAEDSYDVVQLLLDEGANPRARLSFYAEEHETPLQAAAGRGFDRIVKAILEKDPEAAIDRDAVCK